MTTKDAILALAAKIAGTTQDNVSTTAQALNKLAYAVTGETPTTDLMTVDDCIAFITANYTPGGGGGVDVGAPVYIVSSNYAPEVGEYMPNNSMIGGIQVGESVIVPNAPYNSILKVASGCTITTAPDIEQNPVSCTAYVITVDDESITAATAWDGTVTAGTYQDEYNVWSLTVPALTFNETTFTGQALYLYMPRS